VGDKAQSLLAGFEIAAGRIDALPRNLLKTVADFRDGQDQ